MAKTPVKNILAIETSCDETAAAVLRLESKAAWPEITTLSSVVKSQIQLHAKMGGVVPEAAARAHVKNILPVTEKALKDAGVTLEKIDLIAVTYGPGLVPSLIVGVEFAKTLAFACKKPLLPVNHMAGHLYSPLGKLKSQGLKPKDVFPQISLIVSGGHTLLVLMKDEKHYKVLGSTVDDAAGEAFDKVAKLLGLPYPGGPEVSRLAEKGKASINFPRPMLNQKNYNFSFSGLKTAVLYFVKDQTKRHNTADICSSFQEAVVDVLVQKTLRAAKEFKAKSVALSGGVSANKRLREELAQASRKNRLEFFVPEFKLCTDNAEMIGIAASFMLHNGKKPVKPNLIQATPGLEL